MTRPEVPGCDFLPVRLRETVSQTHWEPRPELDIDLNQELFESRYSDSGGKPVG